MVENGYLIQERSPHDRRSFHVRAAGKGIEVFRGLAALFDQHALQLNDLQLSPEGLDAANHALPRVQQLWSTPTSLAPNLRQAAVPNLPPGAGPPATPTPPTSPPHTP